MGGIGREGGRERGTHTHTQTAKQRRRKSPDLLNFLDRNNLNLITFSMQNKKKMRNILIEKGKARCHEKQHFPPTRKR